MKLTTATVSTTLDIPGYKIAESLGIVQGISVRSPGMLGTLKASFQSITSGNIARLTLLCEETRKEAFELLMKHAEELGANAIVGFRFDANEVAPNTTEVLAYGTAVIVEKNN